MKTVRSDIHTRRKFALRVLAASIFALLALVFTSCGSDKGAYTVLAPVVNPGDTLTGDDFIMSSAFTRVRYTATIEGDAPTSEPGYHEIALIVKDSHGTEHRHRCGYTVRSYLCDSVRIEMGNPVTVEKFINTAVDSWRQRIFTFEDPLAVADLGLGTHTVTVVVDGVPYTSTLILEDTTPPQAQPVTVHITSKTSPRAEDFVAGIIDATSVACTFKDTYDFNTTDDVPVTIVLTDEAGNVTEINALATCAVDTTPPEIHNVRDITVYVGDSPSYREGITVSDDSGEVPRLVVDNSLVNPNKIGTYEITYSAEDSSGNRTIVRATVHVVERPVIPESDVKAAAKAIYDAEIAPSAGEDKFSRALAVYNWIRANITFDAKAKFDENDPVGEAYKVLTEKKGGAFSFMLASSELLECAGIKSTRITRLAYEGEAAHWWLLVDIGDGLYHFDACPRTVGAPYDVFMCTDAEVEAYCRDNAIEYYYRFDKSKYPSRGTVSYREPAPSEGGEG